MVGGHLKHWGFNLQIALRRHGWLPMLAFALMAGALVMHFALTPASQKRITAVRASLTTRHVTPATESTQALLAQRHAAFLARLADRNDRADIIKTIFAQGQEAGLKLANGEYQSGCEPDGEYCTLQMVLPVKGPYPQIRNFANSVLEKVPAAAIEEIGFRRDGIKAAMVEARIKFVIYLKGD